MREAIGDWVGFWPFSGAERFSSAICGNGQGTDRVETDGSEVAAGSVIVAPAADFASAPSFGVHICADAFVVSSTIGSRLRDCVDAVVV
jgi:hypothetical protein